MPAVLGIQLYNRIFTGWHAFAQLKHVCYSWFVFGFQSFILHCPLSIFHCPAPSSIAEPLSNSLSLLRCPNALQLSR